MQWSRTDSIETIAGKLEEACGWSPSTILTKDRSPEEWGLPPFPAEEMTLIDAFMWVSAAFAGFSDSELTTLAVSVKMDAPRSAFFLAVERVYQLRGLGHETE